MDLEPLQWVVYMTLFSQSYSWRWRMRWPSWMQQRRWSHSCFVSTVQYILKLGDGERTIEINLTWLNLYNLCNCICVMYCRSITWRRHIWQETLVAHGLRHGLLGHPDRSPPGSVYQYELEIHLGGWNLGRWEEVLYSCKYLNYSLKDRFQFKSTYSLKNAYILHLLRRWMTTKRLPPSVKLKSVWTSSSTNGLKSWHVGIAVWCLPHHPGQARVRPCAFPWHGLEGLWADQLHYLHPHSKQCVHTGDYYLLSESV